MTHFPPRPFAKEAQSEAEKSWLLDFCEAAARDDRDQGRALLTHTVQLSAQSRLGALGYAMRGSAALRLFFHRLTLHPKDAVGEQQLETIQEKFLAGGWTLTSIKAEGPGVYLLRDAEQQAFGIWKPATACRFARESAARGVLSLLGFDDVELHNPMVPTTLGLVFGMEGARPAWLDADSDVSDSEEEEEEVEEDPPLRMETASGRCMVLAASRPEDLGWIAGENQIYRGPVMGVLQPYVTPLPSNWRVPLLSEGLSREVAQREKELHMAHLSTIICLAIIGASDTDDAVLEGADGRVHFVDGEIVLPQPPPEGVILSTVGTDHLAPFHRPDIKEDAYQKLPLHLSLERLIASWDPADFEAAAAYLRSVQLLCADPIIESPDTEMETRYLDGGGVEFFLEEIPSCGFNHLIKPRSLDEPFFQDPQIHALLDRVQRLQQHVAALRAALNPLRKDQRMRLDPFRVLTEMDPNCSHQVYRTASVALHPEHKSMGRAEAYMTSSSFHPNFLGRSLTPQSPKMDDFTLEFTGKTLETLDRLSPHYPAQHTLRMIQRRDSGSSSTSTSTPSPILSGDASSSEQSVYRRNPDIELQLQLLKMQLEEPEIRKQLNPFVLSILQPLLDAVPNDPYLPSAHEYDSDPSPHNSPEKPKVAASSSRAGGQILVLDCQEPDEQELDIPVWTPEPQIT